MPLPQRWCPVARGEYTIGHQGGSFCFDNETPAHRVLLSAFSISSNAVTNAEWLRFMEDGGYEDPLLWLSDGWAWRSAQQVTSPLYWRQTPSEGWRVFTLQGEKPILPGAPVSHISYYEADAFARWAGARLPPEAEWEVAASCHDCLSRPKAGPEAPNEFSQVWEWTQSAYLPYPGFEVAPGAVGEYNGKFMVNQMVLRGQSAATAPGHSRQSYRNFFPPDARWQYSGLRLARQDAQE